MAQRLLRDVEADVSERSDTICELCLGDNPCGARMIAEGYGKECKICMWPFTVLRWRPGPGSRYKKTETCQVCLLNGLPHDINLKEAIIESDFLAQEARRAGKYYERKVRPNDTILKLPRRTPYKRNVARPCALFFRDACTRGPECPYRHETGESSQQNINDRYSGVNCKA